MVGRLLVILVVVAGGLSDKAAVMVLAQPTPRVDLCRCEAKFEYFYSDRRLQSEADRELSYGLGYDYGDTYVDSDGFYIVEGVRVLPDSNPACSATKAVAPGNIGGYGGIFDHNNRELNMGQDFSWLLDRGSGSAKSSSTSGKSGMGGMGGMSGMSGLDGMSGLEGKSGMGGMGGMSGMSSKGGGFDDKFYNDDAWIGDGGKVRRHRFRVSNFGW